MNAARKKTSRKDLGKIRSQAPDDEEVDLEKEEAGVENPALEGDSEPEPVEIVEPVEPDEATGEEVVESVEAIVVKPAPSRKTIGPKEAPAFTWKLVGKSDGLVLTLFKSAEREEVETQHQRHLEEKYYEDLQVLPIESAPKTASPEAPAQTSSTPAVSEPPPLAAPKEKSPSQEPAPREEPAGRRSKSPQTSSGKESKRGREKTERKTTAEKKARAPEKRAKKI